MDKRIQDFLNQCHLLSIGVVDSVDNLPSVYCASCYYVFCPNSLSLCFKSDAESKHIKLAKVNPNVGVIIAKDSKLSLIEGVQIKAHFKEASLEDREAYYLRFPFAKLGSGDVFCLEIMWLKYTNNALLLKEKLIYTKE